MVVSETMTAARMHTVGGELKLEKLPTPKPGDMDVLVRVKACGIVPNSRQHPRQLADVVPPYATAAASRRVRAGPRR